MDHWDLRFLRLAEFVATWSKDPSTKTGAVIVRPDRTIASIGFNGFPRSMSDAPGYYADRGTKYSRIIHCEMNAVLSARERVDGYTLYTTGPCCDRCAVHMLQAGIIRFVFRAPSPEQMARWHTDLGLKYLQESDRELWVLQVERQPTLADISPGGAGEPL